MNSELTFADVVTGFCSSVCSVLSAIARQSCASTTVLFHIFESGTVWNFTRSSLHQSVELWSKKEQATVSCYMHGCCLSLFISASILTGQIHIIPAFHNSFNVCICRIWHIHEENTRNRWGAVSFLSTLLLSLSLPAASQLPRSLCEHWQLPAAAPARPAVAITNKKKKMHNDFFNCCIFDFKTTCWSTVISQHLLCTCGFRLLEIDLYTYTITSGAVWVHVKVPRFVCTLMNVMIGYWKMINLPVKVQPYSFTVAVWTSFSNMWTDQHLKCQLASMFLFFNLSRHVAVSSALSLTPISKDFMRQNSPQRHLV